MTTSPTPSRRPSGPTRRCATCGRSGSGPVIDRREVPELTAGDEPLIPAGLDATLVLVRHGESTYIVEGRFQGQAETPLSPAGLEQASLVASRLAHPDARPALPVPP